MGWGALHFLLIALVTLPLAGTPFAIWIYIQYRRDRRRIAATMSLEEFSASVLEPKMRQLAASIEGDLIKLHWPDSP